MKVSFMMRRNPTNSRKSEVQSKDVREVLINIDYEDKEEMTDSIVFRRHETSKHKANVSTVESIVTHLNHFYDYMLQFDGDEEKTLTLVNLLYEIDEQLNANKIDAHVIKRLQDHIDDPTVTYRDIEIDLYKDILDEIFLNNEKLLDIIIQYNMAVFKDNMVAVEGVTNKLTSADCFIIHCLILYSKLVYIPYFRLTINVGYIEIARVIIIKLGNIINNRLKSYDLFDPDDLNDSFISRLYAFLLNACSIDFERHSKNIERYAVAGMSKETMGMRRVLDEMLSAFVRIGLRKIDDPMDKTSVYNDLDKWTDFGMITTNTASYIQETKKRVTDNIAGVIKPSYIIKTLSSDDDGGTEISQTSRFEIQAEKTNKEQYKIMMNNKNYIMDDIYNKISQKPDMSKGDFLDKIYNSIVKTAKDGFRTDLNKFIVSYIFTSTYGIDVSSVLTLKEYVYVCVYAYERLFKYPTLGTAILAKPKSGRNSVNITEDMFNNRSFLIHDKERVLSHLTKMCSIDYIVISSDGNISRPLDIQDELINWINDGFII